MVSRDRVTLHRGWSQIATGKSPSGYIENNNWQQVEPQRVNQVLCMRHGL